MIYLYRNDTNTSGIIQVIKAVKIEAEIEINVGD